MSAARSPSSGRAACAAALALLSACCLPIACSREAGAFRDRGEPAGPPSGVRFVVDERLLEPAYPSPRLGISFRPPRGWKALAPQLLEQARREAAGPQEEAAAREAESGGGRREGAGFPGGAFRVQPEAAFRQPGNGSLCLLSLLEPAAPGGVSAPLRAIQEYVLELRDALQGGRVEEGRFEVGGFQVVQLRIVDARSVLYRLILSSAADPRLVQIDYLLPRAVFQEEVVKLESSIGSIRPAAGEGGKAGGGAGPPPAGGGREAGRP